MREVQQALAPKSVETVDWTGTFYQYANRLAHLHFLREQNGVDAHLVNVYFFNAPDVASPPDQAHWEGATQLVEAYLGVGRHRLRPFVHKLYVDVSSLAALAAEPPSA